MHYQSLGETGYTVSRVCFGTLTMGPLCANLPITEGAALLREAVGLGLNFFDTAQQYCNYPYLAAGLADHPEVVVASKSYADSYEEMAWAVEEARIALRRDKIDIFLLHELRNLDDLEARLPALEYLCDAKANGIVGAVGFSTHDVTVARRAASLPEIEVLHCMFNRQGIGIRGGSLAEMRQAMAEARSAGKGVYSMKAIGGGALMHQAREALTWVDGQDCLDALAVGMKDRAELATNLAWLAGQEAPEAAAVRLLDRNMAFDKVPTCHKCGKCLKRCAQEALYMEEDGVAWRKERCLYCGYCIAACPWFCISFC